MRLHALTVAAFGPFPQAVHVDFDAVGAAGIFLIHGATGAGKTSLLDAICFALFADVPGARTRRGLVSDHAADGTRPTVVLDFTAAGRHLRLERSPEFSRPKKRGTGHTRVPATVTLQERSGTGWKALSTRHDEVAELLDQLLGMGLAQFAKVVVLPQGDVSAFLRASPEDRRALLERLFDISTFAGVEDWLVDERRRTSAEAAELAGAIHRDVDRLQDILGTEPDAPDWHSIPLDDLPQALDAQSVDLESAVLSLLTQADAASNDLSIASADLHAARTRAQTRARGVAAGQVHEAAVSRGPQIARLRQSVDRARAAVAVSGHLAGLEAAHAEAEESLRDLRAARDAVGVSVSEDSADIGALAQALRALDPVVTDLVHAARAEALAGSAVRTAAQRRDDVEQTLATWREALVAARSELSEVQARLAETTLAADDHPHASGAFEAARRALGIATEVAVLSGACDDAAPALLVARDDVAQAQRLLIDLQQRRLDGMAAELASTLTPGQPCTVCGSPEHPAPAAGGDPVTPADIAGAQAHLATTHEALATLEAEHTSRLSRIETLREQLGPAESFTLAELAQLRDEAEHRLTLAVTARGRLTAAERAVAAATARLHQAQAAESDGVALLAAATATLETAQRSWLSHQRATEAARAQHEACPCRAATEDDGDAASVSSAHAAMSEAVQRLQLALQRSSEAAARQKDRHEAAMDAAAEHGFASLDEARTAQGEVAQIDRHRGLIAEHEQTLAVAAATLADEAVIAALAGPPPDPAAAALAERDAQRAVRQAQSAHSAAESRAAVLRAVQRPLCELVEQYGICRQRAAAVKDLADAATGTAGSNLYRMRLTSFVLAARLERVIALANERLERMQESRYVLEHSDVRVSGGGRSGLDLRVLDQWTGRARDTASLSGGESFVVSLALALGLADAVREEAGGFDLGTLFIDEGFGSLDEDSLEQVMNVLDGLREGGRAVGVVSHVPDLRTRISHQILVHKTATGSDVSVRTIA